VIVKSKIKTCLGCSMNKKGYCLWFPRPKRIPYHVLHKGCKHRKEKVIDAPEVIQIIINNFNGEILNET
jgi:hypothetical protein